MSGERKSPYCMQGRTVSVESILAKAAESICISSGPMLFLPIGIYLDGRLFVRELEKKAAVLGATGSPPCLLSRFALHR
jgi:hypothetical protein